ncbi:hypothetical protein, partial [Methanolapillus africanus]|uniref:hypothetical protein n=1 Tax=Methanolapillus africanus TaxID=3028297 RepID=UPI0030B8DB8D
INRNYYWQLYFICLHSFYLILFGKFKTKFDFGQGLQSNEKSASQKSHLLLKMTFGKTTNFYFVAFTCITFGFNVSVHSLASDFLP